MHEKLTKQTLKKINYFIASFIPKENQTTADAIRVNRFFVASCFLTAFFALIYCLMSIYISGTYFALAMVFSAVLFLLLPLLLKAGLPLHLLTNVFTGIIAFVLVLLIYWEGGIRTANTTPWALVLPAYAMLMQGPRAGIAWMLVSLAIVCAFSYFNFEGIHFPVRFDPSKDAIFNFLSLSGMLCLVTLIFFISENQKRTAQKELEKQKAQLVQINKEKTDFLRTVSHDLKNPLLIIREFARFLDEPNLEPAAKAEYIGFIISSVERMSELIRNLLDIQLIESGKLSLNIQPVSVHYLVYTYIMQNKALAGAREMELVAELPPGDIFVQTDRARLEQVLDNFVSNAMKYSPRNTNIYIRLSENDQHIELCVRDEGPGISAEEQKKLFRQFSIGTSVPRNGEHSSGLGLAIARKIADLLGAEVGCISDVGKGASFYIRFAKKGASLLSNP